MWCPIWFTIAATGLAFVASAFATFFLVIRYAGAAYLLYLAWRLWNGPANSTAAAGSLPESRWHLFLTGMAINLGNPKVIVFFLALLPTVVDLASLTSFGFAELTTLLVIIASTVLTAYAAAAARARRLFTSRRAIRFMNRSSGIAMAGAAASVVAS